MSMRARVDGDVRGILSRAAAYGFLGGMPIDEQIDHALGFVWAVEAASDDPPQPVLDLGSGGGVPGLVLASCWPTERVTLLDANERRTAFLTGEVSTWGGGTRVTVVRGRAEEIGSQEEFRQSFGLVTARSFGGPAVTAECGAPLLRVGGILVVSEPPDEDGSRWDPAGLAMVGLTASARLRFDDRFGYQVLVKSGETPDRYPRRVGIPAKRPLF
jgi:16S rRNA (guanine527-N7)-methyltransferase